MPISFASQQDRPYAISNSLPRSTNRPTWRIEWNTCRYDRTRVRAKRKPVSLSVVAITLTLFVGSVAIADDDTAQSQAMQAWIGKGRGLASWSGNQIPFKDGDKVIFFGDSITSSGTSGNGYITLMDRALKKSHPELKVLLVNSGNSGNKVPNLQARLHSDVLSKKPTVLFIYIGINDVWHDTAWDGSGTPPYAFKAGLQHIIEKSRDRGAAIVLATPSVIGEKTDGSNELDKRLDEYATISRELAKEMNVTLCDLRAAFMDYLKQHNSNNKEKGVLTVDRVHLNDLGNQLVAHKAAEAISEALKQLGGKPDAQITTP